MKKFFGIVLFLLLTTIIAGCGGGGGTGGGGKTATVTGTIIIEQEPQTNQTVKLFGPNNIWKSAVTDGDGRFIIEGVIPGQYYLEFTNDTGTFRSPYEGAVLVSAPGPVDFSITQEFPPDLPGEGN